MSDLTARLTLQRCQLERKLENALHELCVLQKKVHITTRNMEVQVLPDCLDKSVLCYVRLVDKDTEILEDDLYDETKEQLIILQGELQVTRRQVEVLQEKLILHNKLQQQFSDLDQEMSTLKSKYDELERTYLETEQQRLLDKIDFDAKCQSLFEQNERMATEEEDKYHQLETEFDNVRQEMEQVINQYELKRAEMKLRLETLESENEDKRKLENDIALLQQTIDSLEMGFEREKAALLKKERDLEHSRQDILSKNPKLHSSSMKESQSIVELQRKIQELAATGKEMVETDIISDQTSTVYSGSVDNVPILAYSKFPETLPYCEENTSGHSESVSLCKNVFTICDKEKPDSGGLVQSIKAQTHLLQNLRAELKQEQNKSRNAKASLYERIQKLAKENQSGFLSSKSVSHQSLKEAFENSLLEKEKDQESIEALLSSSQYPSVRDTVLDMKARILYLLHENQKLNTDMKSLKRSILSFINRRELTRLSTNSLQKTNSNESGASYATANASNDVDKNILSLPPIDQENNFITISCQDLRSIKEDLEKMVVSFDLNNIDRNAFTDKKTCVEDGFLIKWLKNELGREKCELDVLIKWYEMDKNQLELELTDAKLRLQWTECERQLLRKKLDSTTRDARDLALELTFYKEEDALRPFGSVDNVPTMKKCFSEGHLAVNLTVQSRIHDISLIVFGVDFGKKIEKM
uniref:Uncharacterized protein n=1 Tax=Romanomermis culicivorax TaxID=13658 RepID=A0A915IBN4_ROMCU